MTEIPRACGSCSLCCKLLQIIEPDLQKERDVWCPHCRPGQGGCSIYTDPAKPKICDSFKCLWLKGEVPIELKPDEVRAVLTPSADGKGITVFVDRTVSEIGGWLRKFIQRTIDQGVDVAVIQGEHFDFLSKNQKKLIDKLVQINYDL
jgi:hypothetical protein